MVLQDKRQLNTAQLQDGVINVIIIKKKVKLLAINHKSHNPLLGGHCAVTC